MKKQVYSPLRSRATKKPMPQCPDIVVYQCCNCGKQFRLLGYNVPEVEPFCCREQMQLLSPVAPEEIGVHIDYEIVGGYNENAVQVFWGAEDLPVWVLLKTFTGSYIRYVTPKKVPPMVFPLADEDAYVYCDENPCLKCVFRCKRGFQIYAYFKNKGLVELPLDQMSAHY